MGCNAWNHPANCSCGWGGYTGGGGVRGGYVHTRRIADGRIWAVPSSKYETFTIPNASCPVCGAAVFFYQSPHGGRVFFDELGPPWPKHRCTDNGRLLTPRRVGTHFTAGSVLDDLVLAPQTATLLKKPFSFARPEGWRPLVAQENIAAKAGGEHTQFPVALRERLPGDRLYLPREWPQDAPTYWRWHPTKLGWIEISTMTYGADLEPHEIRENIPGWLENDEELAACLQENLIEPTPSQWNALGWAFSFAWRSDIETDYWAKYLEPVDFKRAHECYERAAESGLWSAMNNLGVMYRDGRGLEVDPIKAFNFFRRAADDLEPISILHLADCYRKGSGCEADADMADFLADLAKEIETERKGK